MSNGRDLKRILERAYNHQSLVGVDVRNLYLSFMDFCGLELRRANLSGCCLSHALLDDCDLTDANLSNAKLNHASLNRANLAGAILANVVVDGASFKGATGLTPSTIEYLRSKGAKGLD
jgi:uncharacterized protein YjbI with pentapeptide repeats